MLKLTLTLSHTQLGEHAIPGQGADRTQGRLGTDVIRSVQVVFLF